jgi:pyrroline-5-carboxylate reductase
MKGTNMSEMSVGFIGGGRVTGIFLEGWKRAGKLPARIVVSDSNAETLAKLKARFPSVEAVVGGTREAASQEVVFLGVHPPVMAEVAGGLKGVLKPGAVLVSLAPKCTIARLKDLLGGFGRIARMNPNAPSVVNFGFNPICFGSELSAADRAAIRSLLEPLGESPEVAEPKIEAYALLTAMGPTYLWFQMQALRELAAEFGLSDAEATPALKRMVCGAARTLLESGMSPAEVMDLVPVKPLAEMEAQVSELYRTRLPALFQKIKP